jgi:hypothetical protein
MKVETATPELVEHVVRHMRQRDVDEIFAVRWSDDREDLVRDWLACRPVVFAEGVVLAADGEPVAVVGVSLVSPGVGIVHMYATDRWREIALAVHRFVVRHVMPSIVAPVFRRLECRALEHHDLAARWLTRLGFRAEGRHPGLGKGGETYVTFGWLNPDFTGGV